MQEVTMNRIKFLMLSVISLLVSLVAASCTSVTPLTRIKENPAMFDALSAEHRNLVQQGMICNGMGQDAVFLAWGMPEGRPVVGQNGKVHFEKWVYTCMRPVMVERPYWGGFYGPACRGMYWNGGWDTAYVPEVCATVTFENGRVIAWERSGSRVNAPAAPYRP